MNVPKIMAIDDDMEMLKQLALMLGGQYDVSVMTSAKQALDSLNRGYLPDLILLDVMMPETDGFSMMEHLHNNPEYKKIPVIFLTGMTDADDEIRGLKLGGSDYIRKPFVREVLLARISKTTVKQEHVPERITALLTENEKKVAEELYQGYTGKEISEKLYYSYSYVKKVIASLKSKLNADTSVELMRKLRE
ncbi:MAG: response regulator [Oscillospiraceae bacterium]|nr:response regulator [Oscillospiraceae bacterium]